MSSNVSSSQCYSTLLPSCLSSTVHKNSSHAFPPNLIITYASYVCQCNCHWLMTVYTVWLMTVHTVILFKYFDTVDYFNPFQSNFSATRIFPSSYLFWAVKRLVYDCSVIHEEKRRTGSDSGAGEQTQQKNASDVFRHWSGTGKS
jgi:hypothetical protein